MVQVARHQIRAPHQHFLLTTVVKIIDSCVFQKPSDYRRHGNGLTDPREARPKATNTSHVKINPDTGLRRVVERLDTLRINQCIHLERDIPVAVLAVATGLTLDPSQYLLP